MGYDGRTNKRNILQVVSVIKQLTKNSVGLWNNTEELKYVL